MTGNMPRKDRNEKSRNAAKHNCEEWSADEVGFLLEEFAQAVGDAGEEAVVAEILGRTIEACRQRFYVERRGKSKVVSYKETITRTITQTETYIGLYDDPEDRWWDFGCTTLNTN